MSRSDVCRSLSSQIIGIVIFSGRKWFAFDRVCVAHSYLSQLDKLCGRILTFTDKGIQITSTFETLSPIPSKDAKLFTVDTVWFLRNLYRSLSVVLCCIAASRKCFLLMGGHFILHGYNNIDGHFKC